MKKNSVNTFLHYNDDYKVIKLICDSSVKYSSYINYVMIVTCTKKID